MPLRSDMEPQEYLAILLRRKWIMVFTVLFLLLGACFYCVLATPLYRSSTTILLENQRVSENYVRPTLSSRIEERLSTLEQQIMSRTRLLSIIDELNLFRKKKEAVPEDKLVKTMQKRIQIEIKNRNSFSLSFLHEDPKVAMRTTERLAALFMEENSEDREKQAIGTSEFLSSQLQRVKKQLELAEEAVKQYKMTYMGELPQQEQANLNKLSRLQDQFRTNADAIRAAEDRKMFIEAQVGMLKNKPRVVVQGDSQNKTETVITVDPAQSLLDDLDSRQRKLSDLALRYTDRHPEIERVRTEIAEMERKIAVAHSMPASPDAAPKVSDPPRTKDPLVYLTQDREVRRLQGQIQTTQAEIESLKAEKEKIQQNIQEVQTKVEQAPKREQEMIALTRDYDNLKRSYDDLLRKKLDADVSQNLEMRQKDELFQVLDTASLPLTPFKPAPKKVFTVAFVLSFAIGFGGVLGLEMLDKTLRDPVDFKRYFQLPVLASIPVMQDRRYRRTVLLNRFALVLGFLVVIGGYAAFILLYGKAFRGMLAF